MAAPACLLKNHTGGLRFTDDSRQTPQEALGPGCNRSNRKGSERRLPGLPTANTFSPARQKFYSWGLSHPNSSTGPHLAPRPRRGAAPMAADSNVQCLAYSKSQALRPAPAAP